jgi:hypothetical protein
MSFMTSNTQHLIREKLYNADLREAWQSELMGMQYVEWLD